MQPSAVPSGTFDIGGDLTVHRLGFGAMRITGRGDPARRDADADALDVAGAAARGDANGR